MFFGMLAWLRLLHQVLYLAKQTCRCGLNNFDLEAAICSRLLCLLLCARLLHYILPAVFFFYYQSV